MPSLRREAFPTLVRGGVGAWFALLTAFGCAPPPPPNLVLVSVDSLRPDHLGCYGYARATSPHLDRLARESVLFERAYSTTTWTLPAHLSMLSSLHPGTHGVLLSSRSLNPGTLLLPELLGRAGYRSGAVVSGPFLDRRYGFDRGWERYDDSILDLDRMRNGDRKSHGVRTSEQTHQLAVGMLDRLVAPDRSSAQRVSAVRPFFLFLHYWDVHYDYAPPPPYERMFDPDYAGDLVATDYERNPGIRRGMAARDLEHVVALYDGEIAWVDSWLGKLLEELARRDLLERTVVVVTADHGDEFFEHGAKGHRKNLYDTTLRVPLLVRLPGARDGGRRVGVPVSLVDVAPTLAALAGIDPPSSFQGRPLLSRRGAPWQPLAPVDLFAELRGGASLVRESWKLHVVEGSRGRPGRLELYDLAGDAGERIDLVRERTRRARELFQELRRARARFRDLGRSLAAQPVVLPPAAEAELRALGYL